MKRLVCIIFILSGISACIYPAPKKPAWVTARPVDNMSYIGIGFSMKTAVNYMQEAKNQALNDLVSEIRVEIQSESLLRMAGRDSNVSSYLSASIRTKAREDIEQFELTDSWENEKEYWVFYKLSKADYLQIKARRLEKAVTSGYDFLVRGITSQRSGDLVTAAGMYVKGLESVHSCADEALLHEHEGKTIDVGIELYSSLKNVFGNISIAADPESVQVKAMQQATFPVLITVTQDNNPLRRFKLKISFRSGSGKISSGNVTGDDGQLELRILNIASKIPRQEILVEADLQALSIAATPFVDELLRVMRSNPPHTIINLDVEQGEKRAFIKAKEGEASETLTRSVAGLLSENYFTVVSDASQADLLIKIDSEIKKGSKVKGEMYDFVEYFISVGIQVMDMDDTRSVINYSVNDHRILSPESSSETVARNNAVKDVMKRISKELKKQLDNITINN
jgi:hypothetical protein